MRLNFRRLPALCLAALGASVVATPSHVYADATASWSEVTGAATPAGFRSFDLNVSLTGTDDFFSARMFANGSFYQDTFGGNTAPNPALVSVFPALAYDTYVTSPGATPSTLILGGFDGTNENATAVFTASQLGIVWGDTVATLNVTNPIARVTFSGNAPTFIGRVSYGPSGGQASSIPLPQVPEPASLALLALGLTTITARRRGK